MFRAFVVISGLPGSGKTTLARQLAPALGLPVLDKDDILNELFEEQGIGDAAWRGRLSRESDGILQERAERSDGAILVSFWRVPGMPPDSGTPTGWLHTLQGRLVNVHCSCSRKLRPRASRPGGAIPAISTTRAPMMTSSRA